MYTDSKYLFENRISATCYDLLVIPYINTHFINVDANLSGLKTPYNKNIYGTSKCLDVLTEGYEDM